MRIESNADSLTKEQAVEAMQAGSKVRHWLFSKGEWIKICGPWYKFEDGCICDFDEFWRYRQEEIWNNGWELVK